MITPQTVRSYQPVFSAAFIAHVEATYPDEATKNKICSVVPLPNHDTDWIRLTAAMMINQQVWAQDKSLQKWLLENRLSGFSKLMQGAAEDDAVKQAVIKRMRGNAPAAMGKLQQYLAQINAA
jgi:hypothetical protein